MLTEHNARAPHCSIMAEFTTYYSDLCERKRAEVTFLVVKLTKTM